MEKVVLVAFTEKKKQTVGETTLLLYFTIVPKKYTAVGKQNKTKTQAAAGGRMTSHFSRSRLKNTEKKIQNSMM